MTREKQLSLSGTVLGVLCRSLRVLMRLDKRVNAEFVSLGEDFSFAVKITDGPCMGLRVSGDSLVPIDPESGEDIDVTIVFKDVTGAIPVLTGKTSVATAFAQHRMMVYGSIDKAMPLVRAIEIAEAYLLPKSVLKKSMAQVPRKNIPSFAVYAGLSLLSSKPAAVKLSGPELPEHEQDLPQEPESSGDSISSAEYAENSLSDSKIPAKVGDLTDAS